MPARSGFNSPTSPSRQLASVVFRYALVIAVSLLLHSLVWWLSDRLDRQSETLRRPTPPIQVKLVPAAPKPVPQTAVESPPAATNPATANKNPVAETTAPKPKPIPKPEPVKPVVKEVKAPRPTPQPVTKVPPAPVIGPLQPKPPAKVPPALPKPHEAAKSPVVPDRKQAPAPATPKAAPAPKVETKNKSVDKPSQSAAKEQQEPEPSEKPAVRPIKQKSVKSDSAQPYRPSRRELEEDPNLPPAGIPHSADSDKPVKQDSPARPAKVPDRKPVRPVEEPVERDDIDHADNRDHRGESEPVKQAGKPVLPSETGNTYPPETGRERHSFSTADSGTASAPRTSPAPTQPQPRETPPPSGQASARPSSGPAAGNNRDEGARVDVAYLHNPKPEYPASARRRKLEGTVRLKVLVLADGTVGNVAVETSSGHDILDQPAMDAVRQWRFVPAKRGGKPVDSWSIIPIKFNFE